MIAPAARSTFWALAAATVLGVLSSLSMIRAEPAQLTVQAGLSEPVKAWRRAMEAGDIAALTRMHDAGTVSFPPTQMKVDGVDAIIKDYAGLFAEYTAHVTFHDAHWIERPPLVVSWGLYTLSLHSKAGGLDRVSHGRFTDAAIRSGGGWRYVVDHASVPTNK